MNACESILGLSPYQGGKPIDELARELGLKNITKLASNENPLGVSSAVKEAVFNSLSSINRYPDGNCFELKKAISEKLSVTTNMISLGNGSNELLELIARVFVSKKNDEIIFSEYAFVVYPLVTQALGATAKVSPAADYGHDLNSMLSLISKNTKLIYVANPNNPTGTLLSDDELYSFLKKVPKNVPVVLDQA
jgi:histidinol-phosphate aminotransferase